MPGGFVAAGPSHQWSIASSSGALRKPDLDRVYEIATEGLEAGGAILMRCQCHRAPLVSWYRGDGKLHMNCSVTGSTVCLVEVAA